MVEIGYLIDDDIHDIFITNVQSIKNETLIEAKRKADVYKENEFIELTDIFSTEFRKIFFVQSKIPRQFLILRLGEIIFDENPKQSSCAFK